MSIASGGLIAGKRSAGALRALVMAAALAVPVATFSPVLAVPARAQQGPASVADLSEKLIGAVVNISTSQKVTQPPNLPKPRAPEGSPFQEFFDELFPQREGEGGGDSPSTRQSLGSGFVIDASGIIVTNNHVIADADEVIANFSDGTQLVAEACRKGSKDRPCRVAGKARKAAGFRQPRRQRRVARRRLGAGDRQSVRLWPHCYARHHLGDRPRHQFRPV